MASRASVTVSIAAERMGALSVISAVRRVVVETSPGNTLDSAGWSSTSSKVSPSLPNFHCHSLSAVMASAPFSRLYHTSQRRKRLAHTKNAQVATFWVAPGGPLLAVVHAGDLIPSMWGYFFICI